MAKRGTRSRTVITRHYVILLHLKQTISIYKHVDVSRTAIANSWLHVVQVERSYVALFFIARTLIN